MSRRSTRLYCVSLFGSPTVPVPTMAPAVESPRDAVAALTVCLPEGGREGAHISGCRKSCQPWVSTTRECGSSLRATAKTNSHPCDERARSPCRVLGVTLFLQCAWRCVRLLPARPAVRIACRCSEGKGGCLSGRTECAGMRARRLCPRVVPNLDAATTACEVKHDAHLDLIQRRHLRARQQPPCTRHHTT